MKSVIKRSFLILLPALVGFGMYKFVVGFGLPGSINAYINKTSMRLALQSPEAMTYAGLDSLPFESHSHKLGDYSGALDKKLKGELVDAKNQLENFKSPKANPTDRLTYEITTWLVDDYLAGEKYEYSGYPISQLSGPHVNLPSFLTDMHTITNQESADNYLSRLREMGRVLDETHGRVQEYADNGVVAPDFIITKTIGVLEAFIKDGPSGNALVTTLPERLEKAGAFSESARDEIRNEAEYIVQTILQPGYEKLIAQQKSLLSKTDSNAGIWRIPDGEKIYAWAIRNNTTTDLTADDLHNTGLAEVARIETAMDKILIGQGLSEGTVSERVRIMMEDPDQIFPNTDEGREAMIDYLYELNEDIMGKAGDYFVTLPPQELEIKRIPEFSEGSAPGGYYQGPSQGFPPLIPARPGRFYINQKDTADNPKWTLPTLLYHEAAPGHHFQISRSQLIKGVPFLRKASPFTAYTEGWALYAERVAAEDMGLYADNPLGDLGRLQAEQFRAVRLVVDTGMHHKRWTREQAIDYMVSKTGMTEAEVTREIERYVVWPGQALAYKTGQLAILRMRDRAEEQLGEKFNLRQFNEMILEDGAMPLGILEREVDNWIAEQKG